MTADSHGSWHPDRSWADPLIALLAMLALLAAGLTLGARQGSARRPAERASLQGRMMELALTGPKVLLGREGSAKDWAKAEAQVKAPWDRALLAVLKAELDRPTEDPGTWVARAGPDDPAGQRFRHACLAAYATGPMPDRVERDEVRHRLGDGYAADLLEARLLDREGGGQWLRDEAQRALKVRLVGAALLALLVLSLAAGGFTVGGYLLVTRNQAPAAPLPQWSLSGRAAILVLLGWFLAFFVAGNVSRLLVLPWPGLRWLAVPLGYLLHASFGLGLLCRAEGLRPGELWHRVAPGRPGRDLAWGVGFFALAVFLVLAVALLSSLILRPEQSPQRDLQELLRSLTGWGPNLVVFLAVAGLAPVFEELLFRGFLLPVLARGGRMTLALGVSALVFGAIHLQPAGLPVLGTLGLVMGLAMRQTGSLRSPILVHACWNGGIFLVMRAFG